MSAPPSNSRRSGSPVQEEQLTERFSLVWPSLAERIEQRDRALGEVADIPRHEGEPLDLRRSGNQHVGLTPGRASGGQAPTQLAGDRRNLGGDRANVAMIPQERVEPGLDSGVRSPRQAEVNLLQRDHTEGHSR